MSTPLLAVDGLSVHFPLRRRGERAVVVRAVDGVSLALERGASLGLVGESGSGKSTLARAMVGLAHPTAGSVRCDGRDLRTLSPAERLEVRRKVQLVLQNPYGSLDPRMTIEAILREPLEIHGIGSARERRARAFALLEAVGLATRHAARYPHEFSGGQRQRIAIARALALEPELLILDEPVSALDVSIRAQILNLLAELRARFSLTLLVIAHDLALVRHLCSRVAVMYFGRVVEHAGTDALFDEPSHPYTQALLASVPVPDPKALRPRVRPQGEPPSPLDPPAGCSFHPRCPEKGWVAGERCVRERPELLPLENSVQRAVACHLRRAEVPR